ncbi:MAG: hypothetical protein AAFR17_14375 [Pseudomonadota bacterium]
MGIAGWIEGGLAWIGARARWLLAIGVLVAFVMPALSAVFRPWLGVFVALVFCVAVLRIDLATLGHRLMRPRHLAVLCLWSVGLMAVTPAVLWGLGQGLGLPEPHLAALVYTGVAPPITSAAALCLLIGLDAVFALELTLVATVLTPLIGPPVAAALLGEAAPIAPLDLASRVAGLILAGGAAALVLRRVMGAERIARKSTALDGVSAIAMWLVVIAVLDGASALVLARPVEALGVLVLALGVNFGLQLVVGCGLARAMPGRAGAAGLAWGNRTVALYLAALPFEPVFALYVAVYQIPMLFTPLLTGPILRRRVRE